MMVLCWTLLFLGGGGGVEQFRDALINVCKLFDVLGIIKLGMCACKSMVPAGIIL